MKKSKLQIFNSADNMVEALSNSFFELIRKTDLQKKTIHIALSGGSTPRLFFKQLANIGKKISWHNGHFYWGDERCVHPDHPDSNFGMTKKYLFDKIDIPPRNLHRIQGEDDPSSEAERYGRHIRQCISENENGFSVFDWILLGLGEDGHTASIFPGDFPVIQSKKICRVASHPQSGQKRITLTLPVINLANRITFLITGQKKSKIVAEILNNKDSEITYPAGMVQSKKNAVEWYLDKEAAALL